MKIYTRTGDSGQTGLFGGNRVEKDHERIEAYGSVDELNAVIGVARTHARSDERLAELDRLLRRLQEDLFVLGADLATPTDGRVEVPRISSEDATRLEREIDRHQETLPPLSSFVLPGGPEPAASLQVARAVARRAERAVVAGMRSHPLRQETLVYLNRLSDLLFVLARWAVHQAGADEELWQPEL